VKRSTIAFLALAVVMAAICVRLGIWQLDRREQRRAMNVRIAGRMAEPPMDVRRVEGDTTQVRVATAIVSGSPDFGHEVLLTHRGNDGSPGVDILTPVRIAGSDSAVIVNRGWVYSPDGMTIDPARWRESDTVFTGYVDSFESAPSDTVRRQGIRRASYEAIAREIPYPIRKFYVVALGDSPADTTTGGQPRVVRLRPPQLGEGPHMSYALQWFAFATIALIGAGIVAARSMHKPGSS
jgi:surfeit locus 1 family protein